MRRMKRRRIKQNGKNADTVKELSSFIYNRHTHDKSMYVGVSEINFIVGLDNILLNNKDKDKLRNLIYSNHMDLFDTEFINEIRGLTKEDFKSICKYHYKKDTFSGLEYFVLRHLIDYHIKEFEMDMVCDRLDEVIKLSVSKDNLVVKVFPTKSQSDNPVSYTVSLLYLVLMHLYKQVNRLEYENLTENLLSKGVPQEKYTNWVIKSVFLCTTPIVTKVVYSLTINADDNYTWFLQLKKLESAYAFLNISKQSGQVKFCFRPHTHYLTSTLDFPVTNTTPSDTNYEARFIESTYTLRKENTLQCKTTIIGKEMVDCVFATQIDEDDKPASMYSALSDGNEIYLAQYTILRRMLSFTKQHEQSKVQINLKAGEYVQSGKYKLITEATDLDKIKWLTKTKTKTHAFDDIEMTISDDKLISIIRKNLQKLGQKNGHVDYIIVILELMNEDKSVIDNTLEPLDKRTADKIKTIIKKLRKRKLISGLTLNEFYKGD